MDWCASSRVMVETAVADGASSFVLLAALRKNGRGELHSLDIASDVGALVDNRDSWHLACGRWGNRRGRARRDTAPRTASHALPARCRPSVSRPVMRVRDLRRRLLLGGVPERRDTSTSRAVGTWGENRGLRANYLFEDSREGRRPGAALMVGRFVAEARRPDGRARRQGLEPRRVVPRQSSAGLRSPPAAGRWRHGARPLRSSC